MTKNLYVLDSNVPEYDPKCLSQFDEHDVMMLSSSMTDLTVRSNTREGKRENIREFFNEFENIKGDKMLNNGGIPIGEGKGTLQVVDHPSMSAEIYKTFTKDSRVGRLLALLHSLTFPEPHKKASLKASKRHKSPVPQPVIADKKYGKIVLISRDPSIRVIASAYGIESEPYKSDRIDTLYTGIEQLTISDELQSELYAHNYKKVLSMLDTKLIANKYFTLRDVTEELSKEDRKNTVIWRYDKKSHTLVEVTAKDFHAVQGIKPKNIEQRIALSALLNQEIPFVTMQGRAGTGKTLLALAAALELLDKKVYEKIIITRSSVSVGGKEQGFYPGGPEDKTIPFLQSFYDNMEVIDKAIKQPGYCEKLLREKKIIPGTFELFRGRTFNNSCVIVDETQNLDKIELITVASRIGVNSKMVFMGDVRQIDDTNLGEFDNGLSIFIDKMKDQYLFAHITLLKTERSEAAEVVNKIFSSY